MGNIVPASAQPILERTLDTVRMRANSNGECFGGEIMDALREAGTAILLRHSGVGVEKVRAEEVVSLALTLPLCGWSSSRFRLSGGWQSRRCRLAGILPSQRR
jgi:hypothetical protein